MATTLVGAALIAEGATRSLNSWRAQRTADAIALAMVSGDPRGANELESALGARVTRLFRDADVVTVTVETRWGTAEASAGTSPRG